MSNTLTTYTFSASTTARSSEVNQNFDDVAKMKNAKAILAGSGSQTVNSGSATLLTLDTETKDPGNNFTNTAGNYKFTAPVAGYYLCTVRFRVVDLGDGKSADGLLYVDGVAVNSAKAYNSVAGSARPAWSFIQYVAASSYIQFYVQHDHGSSRTVDSAIAGFHLLSVD